jgi:lipoprotein-anchoring transpeptidase ErfK/SrfK
MQSFTRKIHISIPGQRLELRDETGRALKSFPVSTSALGIGSEPGSFKTPAGRFCISEKIGHGALSGAVFKSRVPTGETGTEENPDDLVQTRILRLHGLEAHNANTLDRYIYIHGTNHESAIGTPASHGCIRMRNADVIELFDAVDVKTEVLIES